MSTTEDTPTEDTPDEEETKSAPEEESPETETTEGTPSDEPTTPTTPTPEVTPDPESNSEFDQLYNDPDLTPQKLNAKLNEYAEAYRQEFELSLAAEPENVEEVTRDFFKRNSAQSAAQIVWLSANAESESVRLNAAKTVLHEAFADARHDGDPIKDLLNSLTATKPVVVGNKLQPKATP